MDDLDIDNRSTPLRVVCTASTNAISELKGFSKSGLINSQEAMRCTEYFHGAVLVACQAYAVGTVKDINKLNNSNYKNYELYKSRYNTNYNPTLIELINSLANYFKHSEEWSSWPNNPTTKVLRHYNINENTNYPLDIGINYIIGETSDLRSLCEVLEGWRFSLINLRLPNA